MIIIPDIVNEILKNMDSVVIDGDQVPMKVLKNITDLSYKAIKNVTFEDAKNYVSSLDEKEMQKLIVARVCTLENAIKEAMRIEACALVLRSHLHFFHQQNDFNRIMTNFAERII